MEVEVNEEELDMIWNEMNEEQEANEHNEAQGTNIIE